MLTELSHELADAQDDGWWSGSGNPLMQLANTHEDFAELTPPGRGERRPPGFAARR